MQMDGESAYTKAAEVLGKVDPAWKVYTFRIANEGVPDECKNTLGYVHVGMMNADGEVYSQNLYPVKSDPSIDSFALKYINECKSKIPEGYKFLNLDHYEMKYDVKAKGFITEITLNMQEIGKESVDVNGTQSGVYYQLLFTITPDGNIEVKEM